MVLAICLDRLCFFHLLFFSLMLISFAYYAESGDLSFSIMTYLLRYSIAYCSTEGEYNQSPEKLVGGDWKSLQQEEPSLWLKTLANYIIIVTLKSDVILQTKGPIVYVYYSRIIFYAFEYLLFTRIICQGLPSSSRILLHDRNHQKDLWNLTWVTTVYVVVPGARVDRHSSPRFVKCLRLAS